MAESVIPTVISGTASTGNVRTTLPAATSTTLIVLPESAMYRRLLSAVHAGWIIGCASSIGLAVRGSPVAVSQSRMGLRPPCETRQEGLAVGAEHGDSPADTLLGDGDGVRPRVASQSRRVPSAPPVARRVPSGLKAIAETAPKCPLKVWSFDPLRCPTAPPSRRPRRQAFAVRAEGQESTESESGGQVACVSRLATSQMRIPLSPQAARYFPSGLKAAPAQPPSSVLAREYLVARRRIPHLHDSISRHGSAVARSLPSGLKDGADPVGDPIDRHDGLAPGQVPDPDRTR